MGSSDQFVGDWLVSEYVYSSDGQAIGIVRQRRTLQLLTEGRIRVFQQCDPGPTFHTHPMADFAGEWVFDLSIDGRLRRYLGPDVIGHGETWGDGLLIGRGCWPRFGKLFRSFSLFVTPERQLTGGRFFVGPAPIACIVGVAIPTAAQSDWPVLPDRPAETIATDWYGQTQHLSPDGAVMATMPLTRRYCLPYITETTPAGDMTLRFDSEGRTAQISGDGSGFVWRIGALMEGEIFAAPEQSMHFVEICDGATETINGWRQYYRAGRLERVETFRLYVHRHSACR
ncbi:hypothetical protein [Roseiflexus castenholzii]|uniref:Uncharacterized protein n=1 Tax=Roseiflexus castenholzii (strain DSM 13941 / HLO8) TaxID=383372 RepID=A7NPR3_ROSCS|nr:hypothetical protein [Roseiflexus castenholzii]ABU59559.1 hypothetical protein Rcas_3509 [Roseiflexus castenholzii DSM 13941]